MKVQFIAAHRPGRSPSQRFRFEQYFDYFTSKGFEVSLSYLFDEKADTIIYSPGNYAGKLKIFLSSLIKRFRDLQKAKDMDIVFVQREAIMTGFTYFERQFAKESRLIFDFDDAIWLHDVNPAQGILNRLKNVNKTAEIIKAAQLVIAGNVYLADYARQYNENVITIPTTIDTEAYQKRPPDRKKDVICIGWSGSFSTIKHFETVIPALIAVKKKYGNQVTFKVIGDGNYYHEELGINGLPWRKDTEIEDLSEIDIGLMPLPNDEWSKGKCGLKGLQYMALEIPTIMSPVGVNKDIIQEGENGFLAKDVSEWIGKISLLIEDADLREKVGKTGRKTVVEKYSVEANKEKYIQAFTRVTARDY